MTFKIALVLMILLEAVSLLAFVYAGFSLLLLILIGVAVFILSLKNLSWGIYILFGELFVGSRGRLLEYDIISLRMIIFSAVFLAWIISEVRSSTFAKASADRSELGVRIPNTKYKILYTLLLAAVAWGIVWGIAQGNGLLNVFNDANGYLYLLILPAVLAGIQTKEQAEKLLLILAAAVLVIAAKTLLLFIWFTGDLAGVATAYNWVIGSEAGEITGLAGSASRIFLQSQFYALMGLLIWGIGGIGESRESRGSGEWRGWLIVVAALFGVLMSLSRSFWLGGAFAAVLAFFALLHLRVGLGRIVKLTGIIILIAVLEVAGIFGLTKALGGGVSETVLSRTQNPAAEAASGARLLLLPELVEGIKEQPILGHGFGKEITYKSFLPDRVSPENPEGEITSFAFEWGYLDIALKIGLLGLLIYLLFVANIFARGWQAMKIQNSKSEILNKFKIQNTKYLILGTLTGLVALVTLNITTPYLNHPLGIGYLIFTLLVFNLTRSDLDRSTLSDSGEG